MPDLQTVLVAGASAIIGGLITAVARPWGQDYVNRKAEERAAARALASRRIQGIERVIEILAMSGVEGPATYSAEVGARELPAAIAAVGDAALSEAFGRMQAQRRGSAERARARHEASERAGALLRDTRG